MPHLLITGANGHIGRKLTRHFREAGYDLTLVDIRPDKEAGVEGLDVSQWTTDWLERFRGVDCVIHLAGCPRPDAGWAEVIPANLDGTAHVLEASAQAGVKRLIFASSNWVLAGHRHSLEPLSATTVPAPTNAYAMSKLASERLGALYAQARNLSFIALRIGYSRHVDSNLPGPEMAWGSWGQQMWLSDSDLCRGFEAAVSAPADIDFAIANLVSDNAGMRWDLSDGEAIGFTPADGSTPVFNDEVRRSDDRASAGHQLIRKTEASLMAERW